MCPYGLTLLRETGKYHSRCSIGNGLMIRVFCLCAATFLILVPMARAQCRMAIAGANCVEVPQSQRSANLPGPVNIGDTLERGRHNMIMNARYYGLPDVSDGWVYMQVEDDIYRVDWASHKVLERVTDQASRNW